MTSVNMLKSTEGLHVTSTDDDRVLAVARRLRELRKTGLGDRSITQAQLAEALGTSVPSILAWESTNKPTIPPPTRIEAYATFFASEQSDEAKPWQLLHLS